VHFTSPHITDGDAVGSLTPDTVLYASCTKRMKDVRNCEVSLLPALSFSNNVTNLNEIASLGRMLQLV